MKTILIFALILLLIITSIVLPIVYLIKTQDFVIVSIDYSASQNLSIQLAHPRTPDIVFIDVEKESNLDGVHTLILKFKVQSTIMYNSNRKISEYMQSMGLTPYYDYTVIYISTDCN